MAVAFGIAAGAVGVVSLSIQLAESLQKIEELIEEIEIIQDILSDLELGSQSANAASGINMQPCMKVAQRAAKNFVTFSSELQSRVKKSKCRGSVRFDLSRDDINRMLDNLERTKSSLNLAYSASAQKTHHAEASPSTQSRSASTDVFTSTLHHKSTAGESLFRMRTFRWMSKTIWQLEAKRSIAGLSLSLRNYGVVPFHAPIFKSCREGNPFEMQRLFEDRLASPFDENEYGHDLWEVAATLSSYECLRMLHRYGTTIVMQNRPKWVQLALFHVNARLRPDKVLRSGAGRSLRESTIWLRDVIDHCLDDSEEMHLDLCVWLWQCVELPCETIWHTLLSQDTLEDMLDRYSPELHGRNTPLQLAAVAAASNLAPEMPKALAHFIAAIIAHGAELHEADHYHTPLLLYLCILAGNRYLTPLPDSRPRVLLNRLKPWLKALQHVGVDLVAYGAEESLRFRAYCSLGNSVPPSLYWHDFENLTFSNEVFYFTFTYGPTPEDWTVQLEREFDQYVGDFWQMPGLVDEDEVPAMPGGWVDEF
ncbi:hypothetical protein Q7P35_004082 [Cladosporium inversicolor]